MKVGRAMCALVGLILVVGCSGGATQTTPSLEPQTVEISLTDQFRIEPDPISVPAGVPVRFVVTNTGAILHEFYIGDEDDQNHHEEEMMSSPGAMDHDEPGGVSVEPGETEELTYTFAEAGQTLAGCHIPGHYGAGMKATITVGP